MLKRFYVILLFFICFLGLSGQGWYDADVAYLIYDIDSSHTVADYRGDIKMTPASVLKLLTTASALEVVGAENRIVTAVTTDGFVDDSGVLNGNIYIRGAFDPTVESAYLSDASFFAPLINALKGKGIKAVNGDVVVDASFVRRQAVNDKWVLEDIATYYGVGCFGISVCDNVRKIKVKSGKEGQKVSFSFDYPEICLPQVIDRIHVTKTKKRSEQTSNDIHFYVMPYGNEVLAEGTMAENSTYTEPLALTDPVRFFSLLLKRQLILNGIAVSGDAREGVFGGDTVLYSHNSPMLFNIVRETNFRSNNHYAQHLFNLVTKTKIGSTSSPQDTIRDLWKARNVDLSTAILYDGNGLSPMDAVSPRQVVGILNYMWHSDNGYYFFYSLPQCGRDGTVANVFNTSAMYIRAKSGSMSGVQSYAGYVVSQGRCYSFCIFVNKFSCSRQLVRSLIEQTITNAICDYEQTL